MRAARTGAVAVLAAALSGLTACGRPEPVAGTENPTGALESSAQELLRKYDDAWMRKDLAAIDKVLAPRYVYVSSRGDVSDLAKTKALLSSPGYRLDRGRRDAIAAHRYGSTVVLVTHWTGAGAFDGKPFEDDQRCSVVVGFADAAGRVLSEHCTNIPAK